MMDKKIFPYKPEFPELLSQYMELIRDAVKLGKHHDHRRSLFLNFLREAFDVNPSEFEIEHKIKVANVSGYIDALYKYVIFEFKTNLEAEKAAAELELKKYFLSQSSPNDFIALVSDGVKFKTYIFGNEILKEIFEFSLNENDPISSFRSLDDILFSSKKYTPTSSDITTRFGLNSAIFNKSLSILAVLFAQTQDDPSVSVKFNEWNALLSRVYGERLNDNTLFLKHTYLAVFSRLLILNAIFPQAKRTMALYKDIMTGDFFAKNNLPNLAEQDFFSWPLRSSIEKEFIGLLSKVDKYLRVFRLDNVNEDILKGIYQDLIDPESRHALGEYYTPDWIADLAMERLDYKKGKLLDPACGSGTFLLAAIRRFRQNGLKGQSLIKSSIQSLTGIDVHPLAVMMSKANFLLGLASEIKKSKTEVYLPVYMADTLLTSEDKKTKTFKIEISETEGFHIPFETVSREINIDEFIDILAKACERGSKDEKTRLGAWKGFSEKYLTGFSEDEIFFWKQSYNLYINLINSDRDTIWGFILKNAYKPAFVRKEKVDFVVGNPPWLAYRYIKEKGYKESVKKLVLHYKLLESDEIKLFTQMDTSTLFFVYSENNFLSEKGKIAFVLPKSTILPSKQHISFQKRGLTEIHDFSAVSPLFNVRSVLAIRSSRTKKTKNVPCIEYKGRLPEKNMDWATAKKCIEVFKTKKSFKLQPIAESPYYPLFLQGATIVPRCFWFIQKDKEAAGHKDAPYVMTNETAYDESKIEWRLKLAGRVENRFVFHTLLAKGLIPFAILDTETVFLPIIKGKRSFSLADSKVLLENGYRHAADWMHETEKLWQKSQQAEKRTLIQWLNYNQKLSKQNINAEFIVLYNTSGTNIAAALYNSSRDKGGELRSNGFIADAKTYYYYPKNIEEGDYLVAVLNSDVVNRTIKEYQPQGLYGERDIHRRPFEVCMIPRYDENDKLHVSLSTLGYSCRQKMLEFAPQLQGRVGRIRTDVKKLLKTEMVKINKSVRQLLIEAGQNGTTIIADKVENGDLFK